MKNKIISLITAATMLAATGAVMADAPEVNVVVNGATINFADQKAVIENDRTLIPARGAFEAMGAKVEWDGEARTVTVKNDRNTKIAVLTIDSDKMVVTTYTSLFDSTKEEITLDVPAQIMNDRTMIPLRAVGEAMGATVAWDGETYTASITTAEGEKAQAEKDKAQNAAASEDKTEDTTEDKTEDAAEDKTEDAADDKTDDTTDEKTEDAVEEAEVSIATLSISEVEAVNEDEVVVSVDLKGLALYPEYHVSGVTVTLEYDSEVLELKNAILVNGDAEIANAVGASNGEYTDTKLKVAYATFDKAAAATADGSVMKLTFKVLKDEATEVVMSTGYNTELGYDAIVVLSDSNGNNQNLEGTKLIVDETPLVIE